MLNATIADEKPSRLLNFAHITQLTVLFILLSTVILGLARLAFIGQHGVLEISSSVLWDTLYWGMRLDWRTAATMAVVLYVLVGIALCLWRGYAQQWMTYYRLGLAGLLCLICLLAVVNHFYYFNFQNHIDIFIFEFLDEGNAGAVWDAMWQDYPVFWASLCLALTCWLCFWLLNHLAAWSQRHVWMPKRVGLRYVYVVLSVLLLLVSARGSVGTFPLMLSEISIAGDVFLNRALANGPLAFSDAYVAWKNMQHIKPVSEKELAAAYETWFEQPYAGQANVLLDETGLKQLNMPEKFSKVLSEPLPESISKNRPDVVMVQMESWGGHVAAMQAENNPILGAFTQHRDEDYWFNNFLSSTKGTLNSIEKLVANTGVGHIAKGAYRHVPFSATPASMFQQLGYHTVFITSGTRTWSNIDQFIPYQGFDEMIDVEDIRQRLPHALHDGSWGVFDGFTFDYVLQRLQEKHRKPVFIYVLTITNHSPYSIPEGSDLPALHVPEKLQNKVFSHDLEKANRVMKTYQYASNALGEMMSSIKTSALREQTIVAATGDHYMRDLFNYYLESSDIVYQYQVPFYLYLPEQYQKGAHYTPARFGSHKDIFPTVFQRIIGDKLFATGQDMLAEDVVGGQSIAISEEFVMSEDGAVLNIGKTPVYYQWQDGALQTVAENATLADLKAKHQAYATLLRWQTLQDIQRSEP